MRLEKDYKEFIVLLNEHSVEYLIVGANAMSEASCSCSNPL